MNIVEQFKEIIAKEQEAQLIPFLKTLSPDDKKQLTPLIKTLSQDYWAYGKVYNQEGNIQGTSLQQLMTLQCAFVCLTQVDYEKSIAYVWFMWQDSFKKITEWYVPTWFTGFVNATVDNEFISWDYNWLMDVTERGVLQPSKEVVTRSIPAMIFESTGSGRHARCNPKNLLKRPITLQEHIWYLFEYVSTLHACDRYMQFDKKSAKEKTGWNPLFTQFAAEGKIDRQRLLKESLLASNKNFNKVLSGWFIQLFTDLQPTTAELIALQKELISVLSAPHSKPVNAILGAIKNIHQESSFNLDPFLDAVPALLASDTKSIVNTTISILEKIVQQQPHHAKNIGRLACHAFIHQDDSLQEKAAKLITAVMAPDDATLQEALQPYKSTMLLSARKLLAGYSDSLVTDIKSATALHPENETPQNKVLVSIPAVASFDDLVFLASQAFDNNQPWHIAVFPAALLQWQKEIGPADLQKFEPALQRALKMKGKPLTGKQGELDYWLAMFFIEVCSQWVNTYPTETTTLRKQLEKFNPVRQEQIPPSTQSYYSLDPCGPYQHLLVLALQKLRQQDTLPLLSTPTHEPGWIDALILTKRLVQYEESKTVPHEMDLQVAISRCYLYNTGPAIDLAEKKLSNEYRNLLLFLFDKHPEPQPPFQIQSAWMTASLTKKQKRTYKAFESFPWYKQPISYYTGQHQWGTVGEASDYHKSMQVIREKDTIKADSSISANQPLIIADYMRFKRYATIGQNDFHRILLLMPNNPDPLLADTLETSLAYPDFYEEQDRKFVIAVVQALHSIWDGSGNMAHVFIANCILNVDKTVANLAAEIWINGVSNNNNIRSAEIGEAIGILEKAAFAPIKRFTDLVMQQLIRISDKHNRELQIVIEQLLKQLPDQPITNLKKLLEIYIELLALNNVAVTDRLILDKLSSWKETKAFQKIAGTLLGKS
jgi:hypothetical protein